ncbi:pseudouridine synthase [Pleurotus eryngii]|uniref:Pseudouridine synthase n=1 Tax=Pleurotus eryngii TaxID=5323 RepID=A0A9P5ZMN1_PLEER|nr:pseudouridine synthase [Pleurotus eryngii]
MSYTNFRYRFLRSGPLLRVMTNPPSSYENWTREELIARLVQLDDSPKLNTTSSASSKKIPDKPFSFASYSRRKIALKFCYSGWEYNGLAHQLGHTPLPTVEAHARLIDSSAGFEGCGFERCGRTDKGVSAAGQVVSLWVRSSQKFQPSPTKAATDPPEVAYDTESSNLLGDFGTFDDDIVEASNTSIAPVADTSELRYVSILNRVLPPTIRVLAWSPVQDDFSARFNCKYRHYKYFFSPTGLDLSLTREGASRLVGEHDFRNLCKLDPAKQITSFKRRIIRADISPVGDGMYVFDLVGTAFLYHQVRHIMAILFLIGAGIEPPSVVSALLNVAPGAETDHSPLEVVDRKPEYQMADGLPLMLWDCGYSENDVRWQTDSEANLYHELDSILARSTVHNVLDSHFLEAAAQYHPPPPQPFPLPTTGVDISSGSEAFNIPLGGGTSKRVVTYVPLLQRKRLESVEVVNERWRIAFDFTVGVGKDERTGKKGMGFDPSSIHPQAGDSIVFEFRSGAHSAVQSTYDNPCTPLEGGFNSGVITVADNLEVDAPGLPQIRLLVNSTEPLWFFDQAGGLCREGAVLSANPTSSQTAGGFVENASRVPASPPPSSSTSSDSPSSSTGSTTGEAASAQSTGSNTGYRDAVSGAAVLFGLVIGLL